MRPTIRLATEFDARAISDIYAPFCESTPVSFETIAPDVEEMRARIASTLASLPWLVCERDDGILGYAYASAHRARAAYRWSVDVSAYVRADTRRAGVGRALYTSLLALLRLQGFYTAVAGITLPNPGSVGLHAAVGFEAIGVYRGIGFKCGAWQDVAWYERTLRDRVATPEEPLEFARVRELDGYQESLDLGIALLNRPRSGPSD